ncbi:ADYC domain-containing protein [Nannocystis sp. ILAH1]|uniref:ADYC domain-containing protein n=1 Tax=Nannocystis sp. ILAH1 TaxID=2996789 RepID=UPI00226F4ADC|nr:ADYC domain-containing protein [Nannocystis sp. ILAH1]MCY0986914.1 ADYC domain-containing protein [Nannocystis sp. ILAH1]
MKMRMIKEVVFTLGMAAMTGACANEPEGELEFRDDTGCGNCGGNGSNSAHANEYPIDKLSLSSAPNEARITVIGIEDPLGTLYWLTTAGDDLVAFDRLTLTDVASAGELVGWTIKLYRAGTPEEPAEEIDIEILGFDGNIASWADEGPAISAYALAYHDSGNYNELYPVCPDPEEDGADVITSTIISGEIYLEHSKQIVDVAPGWITIACLGNAVAKMKRMGYGPNQAFPGQGTPATVNQRQSTIRMITADYCGEGVSFTEDGIHLDWENLAETVSPDTAPLWLNVEALWDEDGAICLSNPRLATLPEVAALCTLPTCTPQMVTEQHEWTSWRLPELSGSTG